MNMGDPAYVAMIQARIAMCFGTDAAMIRRVMAAHIQDTPSVETMILEGDTILFNRNYVAATARSPAGRTQIVADIAALFTKEPADA